MEKQKQRTEEEWRRLHENAICAFIAGRAANYVQMNYTQCVEEAIYGADYLVEQLKIQEEKEEKETTTEK